MTCPLYTACQNWNAHHISNEDPLLQLLGNLLTEVLLLTIIWHLQHTIWSLLSLFFAQSIPEDTFNYRTVFSIVWFFMVVVFKSSNGTSDFSKELKAANNIACFLDRKNKFFFVYTIYYMYSKLQNFIKTHQISWTISEEIKYWEFTRLYLHSVTINLKFKVHKTNTSYSYINVLNL